MQVLPVRPGTPADLAGASVALGNFDGVHRGHQAVIAAARAAAPDAPLGVAVFDPHPRRFFQPHAEPFRILSDAVRNRVLGEEQGAHVLYRIPFDRALSLMDDAAFAREVLVGALGARHVTVGRDFAFGRDRMGDAASLTRLGAELGFGVDVVQAVRDGEEDCSSTAIRAALRAGDPEAAARMMTRPWIVDGVVERGDQRGRGLGFPTANLPLGEFLRPKLGVYAMTVHVEATRAAPASDHAAVGYIGRRPMFAGEDERLEAHLFDFEGDLYGRRIEVAVHAFLRGDMTFDGVEGLKAQIAKDAAAAKAVLDRMGR